MMIKIGESGHPVFRSTSPSPRGVLKSRGGGTLSRLVLVGQSDPLFVPTSSLMGTPTPSTHGPAQEDLLQKCQERVERLSQHNRVIKFWTDAGFLTTIDVGQFLMTKDTEEFSQFTEPVACRAPCQEMKIYLNQKVGFEGTQRLDPYWKWQPATCKVNMEWKWNWICKQRQF